MDRKIRFFFARYFVLYVFLIRFFQKQMYYTFFQKQKHVFSDLWFQMQSAIVGNAYTPVSKLSAIAQTLRRHNSAGIYRI